MCVCVSLSLSLSLSLSRARSLSLTRAHTILSYAHADLYNAAGETTWETDRQGRLYKK